MLVNLPSVALPFLPEFLPLLLSPFFFFYLTLVVLSISQLHHCDDFLNIPWHLPPFLLLLLFIPLLFFLPFLIQRSLLLFFSFPLCPFFTFFFISVVSISTQFSSFISFAWFKFIITMITMQFLFVSSSISASFFFSFLFSTCSFLPFLLFLPPSSLLHMPVWRFPQFSLSFPGAVLPAPALFPSLVYRDAMTTSKATCCRNVFMTPAPKLKS